MKTARSPTDSISDRFRPFRLTLVVRVSCRINQGMWIWIITDCSPCDKFEISDLWHLRLTIHAGDFSFLCSPTSWKTIDVTQHIQQTFCKARYLSRTLWYRLPLAWRRWRWRSWGGNCHLSAFGGSFDEVIYLCTGAGGRFFSSFEAGSESAFSWVDQWVQWLVKWSRAAVVRTSTPGWVVTRSHRISSIFVVSPVSQSTCKSQVFDGRG